MVIGLVTNLVKLMERWKKMEIDLDLQKVKPMVKLMKMARRMKMEIGLVKTKEMRMVKRKEKLMD